MVKKKRPGHYCKICGERKANEKFSGKGHAVHICKKCQSLPADTQRDMRRIRDVERLFGKYPLSRQDWELLEKYSKKYADKESGRFAQDMLDNLRTKPASDENEEEYEEQPYAEFDEDTRYEIREWLRETLFDYICRKGHEPENKQRQKIINQLNQETMDVFFVCFKTDESFTTLWDELVKEVQVEIAELDDEES